MAYDDRDDDLRHDVDLEPDEAREVLADLAALLDQPAPLEDCPFTLSAEVKRGTPARQPGLFEED